MKKYITRALGTIGALLSLQSGLFWYISATNQLAASPDAASLTDKLSRLTYLANQTNLWAAVCASAAGVALGVATAIND